MRDRPLEALVAAFAGKRILILGDVILDEYIWGDVRRVSPEAPVLVVEVRRRTCVPGGAANVAANVAALGGQALLGGVVGKDDAGAELRGLLQERNIQAAGLLIDPDRPTTTKTRIVAHNQQVVRLDCEQIHPLAANLENGLATWVERCLPDVDVCVVSDYAKGVVSEALAQHVIGRSKPLGRPVVVDPKGRDYTRYRGATVVKPNALEMANVVNQSLVTDTEFRAASQGLATLLEGSALVVTRGAHGMFVYQPGCEPVTICSTAHQVFDVTGAGDTVTSALALGLAAGLSLTEAAALANRAAGIVVGKVGTGTVTAAELLQSSSSE